MGRTEDNLKALELKVSDLGKAIADHKESIATLAEEIEALGDGIKSLDSQVAQGPSSRCPSVRTEVRRRTTSSARDIRCVCQEGRRERRCHRDDGQHGCRLGKGDH